MLPQIASFESFFEGGELPSNYLISGLASLPIYESTTLFKRPRYKIPPDMEPLDTNL